MSKKTIIHAIILARGGSKGIKNKNLVKINNKPLLYWSILQSQLSKNINQTWVSSDDKKILKIARKFGSKTILRPKKYASDFSSSESAWKHAIQYIESENINIDIVVGIQPTSPLRDKNDFDKALKVFKLNKLHSLFSANRTNDTNIWSFKNRKLKANYNYEKRKMRQQIKEKYLENGSFYIFDKKKFLHHNCRLFGKIGFYLMKKNNSFQIDDFEDLKIIKKIFKN